MEHISILVIIIIHNFIFRLDSERTEMQHNRSQSLASMDAIEQGVHRFKASKEDLNCVHFIG